MRCTPVSSCNTSPHKRATMAMNGGRIRTFNPLWLSKSTFCQTSEICQMSGISSIPFTRGVSAAGRVFRVSELYRDSLVFSSMEIMSQCILFSTPAARTTLSVTPIHCTRPSFWMRKYFLKLLCHCQSSLQALSGGYICYSVCNSTVSPPPRFKNAHWPVDGHSTLAMARTENSSSGIVSQRSTTTL